MAEKTYAVTNGAAPGAAARSSAPNAPSKEFESSQVLRPESDLSAFLSGLRFEKRNVLDELPFDLHIGWQS